MPGPHEGDVHREGKIAGRAHAQFVGDQDPHRSVAFGHDQGTAIMHGLTRTRRILITPELGGFGQVRMHLFSIINLVDFVIITTRVRGSVASLTASGIYCPRLLALPSSRYRAASRQIFLMPFPCRYPKDSMPDGLLAYQVSSIRC